MAEAYDILDASSARIDRLRAQYFGPDGAKRYGALRSLRTDAKQLLALRQQTLRASGEARAAMERRYVEQHRAASVRHPVLASFDLRTPEADKLEDLATDEVLVEEGTMRRPLDAPLRSMLDDVRASIEDMEVALRDDPGLVWRLPGVVQATLLGHGVSASGMVAAHARDLVRGQAKREAVLRAFVSILGVGLGIAAALPSGGTSVAVAASATAVVDGFQLYLGVEQHRFLSAASGTALDRRDALTDQAPSGAGLALDALGAFTGASTTLAALRKTAFVRLFAESGPRGEMARGLAERLGADRAAALVEVLGEGPAELLYRDLAPEIWLSLSGLSEPRLALVAEGLGAPGLRAVQAELGPKAAAIWLEGVTDPALSGLAATVIEGSDWARIGRRFSPLEVSELAPTLKARGLADLAAHLEDVPFVLRDDGTLLVDAQLVFAPHALARRLGVEELRAARAALEALRERAPAIRALGPLTSREVRGLARLREAPDPSFVGRLERTKDKQGVQAVVRALEPTPKTPARALNAPGGRLDLDDPGVLRALRQHLAEVDPSVPRSRGIGGAHNMVSFEAAAKVLGAEIVSRTPHPKMPGVYHFEYRMLCSTSRARRQGSSKPVCSTRPSTIPASSAIQRWQLVSWRPL